MCPTGAAREEALKTMSQLEAQVVRAVAQGVNGCGKLSTHCSICSDSFDPDSGSSRDGFDCIYNYTVMYLQLH